MDIHKLTEKIEKRFNVNVIGNGKKERIYLTIRPKNIDLGNGFLIDVHSILINETRGVILFSRTDSMDDAIGWTHLEELEYE